MMDDEKGPIDKLTDTHWNCKDGNAEFNWRMIYSVSIMGFINLDETANAEPGHRSGLHG